MEVVRVILECSRYSLVGCLITASNLLCRLVRLSLLLKYKISLFFLKVEEGMSRQSNMDVMTLIKD
jgi:hypothetical protein